MADTIVTFNGERKHEVHITGVFSASDETDEVVVDLSSLVNGAGETATKLSLQDARWAISGFDHVLLEWDNSSDVPMLVCTGEGGASFCRSGGMVSSGTGGTGDVVLSTVGGSAGNSYDITLNFKVKY